MTEDEPISNGCHDRLMSEVSTEDIKPQTFIVKALRSESFCGGELKSLVSLGRRVNRSGSLYIPPKISDQLIQKTQKQKRGKVDHTMYLKERGTIRDMILQGEIEEARQYLIGEMPEFYNHSTQTRAVIDALKFLSLVEGSELENAIEFSCSQFPQYASEPLKYAIQTKNNRGQLQTMPIINLTALLCYSHPLQSEYAYLLSEEQRHLLIDGINNEIISKHIFLVTHFAIEFGNKIVGKAPLSQMENVF